LVPQIKVWTEFIISTLSSKETSGEVTSLSGADKREVRDNREKW
jgi:hypothetical protein